MSELLSELDHRDELECMNSRLLALSVAAGSMCGARADVLAGFHQLLIDASDAMQRCVDAFDAGGEQQTADIERPAADHWKNYSRLESPVCDIFGSVTLFCQVFDDVFDRNPDHDGIFDVYRLSPEQATALIRARAVLARDVLDLKNTYYGKEIGRRGHAE